MIQNLDTATTMSAESGVLGDHALRLVVEASRLVNTNSLMETNVVLIALMVMETKTKKFATPMNAQLIVKAAGESTALAPPPVAVVHKPVFSLSP